LQKKVFTERSFLAHNDNRNCSSKTGWISAPKPRKNTILKHFLKGILKGKSPAPNLKNLLTNHYRSLDAATPIRLQPRHQATLTQPSQCILQHNVTNQNVYTHMATPNDSNHAAMRMRFAA